MAGVQGNGQTELIEAIMGLRPVLAGTVSLAGDRIDGWTPKKVLRAGVGYVPEDRSVDGLVKEFSVAENLVLDIYDRPPFGAGLALQPDAIAASAKERIEQFDVRTSSADAAVGTLSGGNQQKVIVARELSRPLKLFIAAQPTRGVDVGSIEFIHSRIIRERDIGTAVMVVSSELDEVIGLADRIAVMYRGRIIGIVGPDTPREEIGLLMAGISPDDGPRRRRGNTTRPPTTCPVPVRRRPAPDGSPASDAGLRERGRGMTNPQPAVRLAGQGAGERGAGRAERARQDRTGRGGDRAGPPVAKPDPTPEPKPSLGRLFLDNLWAANTFTVTVLRWCWRSWSARC